MNLLNLATGTGAILLSGVLSVVLLFIVYRVDLLVTRKINETRHLLEGKKSIAIVLGAVLFSQALLFRHALYPVMTVVRIAIINKLSGMSILTTVLYSLLYIVIMAVLSILLVGLSLWLFSLMNRQIDEKQEILKDNVAVAIFLAFVVLSITVIIDQGIADLAQSLIPEVQKGVIRIQ